MRAVWKGSIRFGLVYIPVAVYPATREEKLSFRQLRVSDLSPIAYRKVAVADGKEVSDEQIVKGYEYQRGSFVVLQDEDLEKVRLESTHSIEISDFVEAAEVDPKFFYRPYFLEAQKGGEKAYALLRKGLKETKKLGIAKVVISNREYLAAVRPDGELLVLELMRFSEEMRKPEELRVPTEEANAKEVDMAKTLIASMTVRWDPSKYRNEYRDAVMEIIEKKARHETLPAAPARATKPTNVVDLLSVLQESINKNKDLRPSKERPSSGGRRPLQRTRSGVSRTRRKTAV
jgi:DNA end-binding protein Ku